MMYSDTIQIDSVALDNRAEIDISQGQLNTSMLNEK